MIRLIINADDFGLSRIFNEKILDLLERGIIKSTTVMVNRIDGSQKDQIEILAELAKLEKISVGLHLEFDLEKSLKEQIEKQYGDFKSIFNVAPSHLDIHKLIANEDVVIAVNEFALEKKLPVRNHGIESSAKQTTYPALLCRNDVLDLDEVKQYIESLKDRESGEIISHPGDYDPKSASKLNKERLSDYNTLVELDNWLKTRKNISIISYKVL